LSFQAARLEVGGDVNRLVEQVETAIGRILETLPFLRMRIPALVKGSREGGVRDHTSWKEQSNGKGK
jgi:hypothetical protein